MMIIDTLLMIEGQLIEMILEVQFRDVGLPYMMATYKLHKMKYRWLTNVASCVFLGLTTIITQALHLVVVELKTWCKLCSETYKRFDKVPPNIYWIIESLFDFMLNLPPWIYCIYMVGITRCYKIIPLLEQTTSQRLFNSLSNLHFSNTIDHKKQSIWVHINATTGKVDLAK